MGSSANTAEKLRQQALWQKQNFNPRDSAASASQVHSSPASSVPCLLSLRILIVISSLHCQAVRESRQALWCCMRYHEIWDECHRLYALIMWGKGCCCMMDMVLINCLYICCRRRVTCTSLEVQQPEVRWGVVC